MNDMRSVSTGRKTRRDGIMNGISIQEVGIECLLIDFVKKLVRWLVMA
jgi:hypothetical protein